MLESREVPANFYWDPQSNLDLSSTNLSNWLNPQGVRCGVQMIGAPIPGPNSDDTLIFGEDLSNKTGHGTVGVGGTGGSNGPSYNTLDCNLDYVPQSGNQTGPLYAPTDYYGLTLKYTYGIGTVKLIHSSYVNYFEMRGGNINQLPVGNEGGANHVTVNNLLTWTAGTINTNAQAGFLNLNIGAHGWVDPGEGLSVTTGSTIILKGDSTNETGSSAVLQQGFIDIANGDGIDVGGFAKFQINAPIHPTEYTLATVGVTVVADLVVEGRKKLYIREDGQAIISGADSKSATVPPHCQLDTFIDNEGHFIIEGQVQVRVDGVKKENGNDTYSYFQDNDSESETIACLEMDANSEISCKGNFVSQTGSIIIAEHFIGKNISEATNTRILVDTSRTIVIGGAVFVKNTQTYTAKLYLGGVVSFLDGVNLNFYVRNVDILGNLYTTFSSLSSSLQMTFEDTATIRLQDSHPVPGFTEITVPEGHREKLVSSGVGLTSNFANITFVCTDFPGLFQLVLGTNSFEAKYTP
jgi:hypothetical protein